MESTNLLKNLLAGHENLCMSSRTHLQGKEKLLLRFPGFFPSAHRIFGGGLV
jgi:hypothetical protein